MHFETKKLIESYSANLEEKINKDNIEINKAIANANRGTKNAEKIKNAGYEVSNSYGSTVIENPKTGKTVDLGYDVNKDNKDKIDWKGKLDSERPFVNKTTRGDYDIKADRIPKSAKVGKTKAVGRSGKDVSVYQQNDELDSYSPRDINDFKHSISKDINDYKRAVLNRDEKRRWADRGEEENAYYEDRVKKAQEDLDRHKKYTADYDKEAKDSEATRQAIIDRAREKRAKNESALAESSYAQYESVLSAINNAISSLGDNEDIQELLQNIIGICRDIADDRDLYVESALTETSLEDYKKKENFENEEDYKSALEDDKNTILNTLQELEDKLNLRDSLDLIEGLLEEIEEFYLNK